MMESSFAPGHEFAGRYRLTQLLCVGHTVELYLAEDLTLQRQVVIKVLLAHLAAHEEVRRAFREQIIQAATFRHPYVARVFDAGATPLGVPFPISDLGPGDRVALVAGGIGLAPLVLLARRLSEKGIQADLFYGGRNESEVLKRAEVRAFFAAGFLNAFAHAALYTFYSLYLINHGYSKGTVGWMWSLGVFIEIAVFQYLPQLTRRYDLARVGRYKLNKKLGLNLPEHVRAVTREDIIKIIYYIIGLSEAGSLVAHLNSANLKKRLPELELWVQQGCLIQVTAQSFVGRFGRSAKSASGELMRRGLVHILASDAHDCTHRPPLLDEAWRYTARHYGEETARLLLEDNPRATLTGADLPFTEMEVKKRNWFSRFHWRR